MATAIFEFKGHSYLIIACQFSGYIVVSRIKDHTAQETISSFASIFAELGTPYTIHFEYSMNYMSSQFADFCKEVNVTLVYALLSIIPVIMLNIL